MIKKTNRLLSFLLALTLLLTTGCDLFKSEKEREMAKVYKATKNTSLLTGIWVPPVASLIKTQSKANKRYAEVADAGINMAYTLFDEMADPKLMQRVLDAAQKNGIKLMVSLVAGNEEASLKIVNATKDHPAVLGYNMGDEPGGAAFEELGRLKEKIRAIVSEDKIIMCNMLPNYAPGSAYGVEADEEFNIYEKFLDVYMQTVKPDVLSFDHYPFTSDKGNDQGRISLMIENLCDIRNTGVKYGVDTWGFVQNSSWAGMRIPDANELRFVTNLHLIFGLKSFSYFLYCSPSDTPGVEGTFTGMITYKGKKTDIYKRVQKQNEELNAMKGVYLNYDHKGFVLHNFDWVHEFYLSDCEIYEKYKELSSVESEGNVLIGCFDKDGQTGLYVMNFDYTKGTTVKLNLEKDIDYRVWGAKGLEQMETGNAVSISLRPGEARFIEIFN